MEATLHKNQKAINAQHIIEILSKMKANGIMVIPMNPPYQYRISGILEVYPTNSKFHHIKLNKRGTFLRLEDLVEKYLGKK